MNEAEREIACEAPPDVRRERQRTAEPSPRIDGRFDHQARLDRTLREYDGTRDDVGRIGRDGARSRADSKHHHAGGSYAHRVTVTCGLVLAVVTGCGDFDDLDGAFYDGDHRTVHCGINIDTASGVSRDLLDATLDRAAQRGEVVELYGHRPGVSIRVDSIEYVLEGAHARGLAFATYSDIAHGTDTRPALALSFDDTSIAEWAALRPLFQAMGARVTFFVSRYHATSAEQRAQLAQLAADGHAIESHGVNHFRATDYVEHFGLDAYVANEVVPSITVLRDAGFEVTSFAYPFAARTGELDTAIARHLPVLRSSTFEHSVNQPFCPR